MKTPRERHHIKKKKNAFKFVGYARSFSRKQPAKGRGNLGCVRQPHGPDTAPYGEGASHTPLVPCFTSGMPPAVARKKKAKVRVEDVTEETVDPEAEADHGEEGGSDEEQLRSDMQEPDRDTVASSLPTAHPLASFTAA
jgi:hypothetical protein